MAFGAAALEAGGTQNRPERAHKKNRSVTIPHMMTDATAT
jgi:hypothetical protein